MMAKGMSQDYGQRSDAVRNASAVRVAARKTFDRLGGELTMDDVAVEASLSKGTVYRVFPTREALIEEMTFETLRETATAYAEAALSEDPAAALADILRAGPLTSAGRAHVAAQDQSSIRVRDALSDTASELEGLLDVLKAKGLVDPQVNAWHIRVLIRGLFSVLPDYPNCSASDADQLTTIILRGIRVESPA
jgi:AcrR family transcriptional regulator